MTQDISKQDIQAPFRDAPPAIRKIMKRILEAEKEKLYMQRPRAIKEDIIKIIEEEVK